MVDREIIFSDHAKEKLALLTTEETI